MSPGSVYHFRLSRFTINYDSTEHSQERWAGYIAQMGAKKNAYRILVGKPEGKRPLERPRRRWTDNIKIDLREIGWNGMV
jgi:hypothetical protein